MKGKIIAKIKLPKNKNIKYICKKDKNYYEGLNYAVKKAKGKYIGILNAGDTYFDNNVLRMVIKKGLSKNCDLLFGNLIYINDMNDHKRIWKYPIQELNLITALKIASPTMFIKKNIAILYPYNTAYNISSDTDFNLCISKKNFNFVYLNKFLVFMKTGGLSTNPWLFLKKMKEDLLILKKYFGILFLIIYAYKIIIKINILRFNKRK